MSKKQLTWALSFLFLSLGCTKKQAEQIHIAGPFYRDIISGLTVRLKEKLPQIDVRWETISSPEISSRLKAHDGNFLPDIIITSDREFLAAQAKLGKWTAFQPAEADQLGCASVGKPMYYPIRYAVKGIGFHPDMIKEEKLPTRWVQVDSVESDLSYPDRLAKLERKEIAFAAVLVENVLEAKRRKVPLKIHYPKEGPVVTPTFIAVRSESKFPQNSILVAEALLSKEAQTVIQQSRLHPARLDMEGPEGTTSLKEILDKVGCEDPNAPTLSE